MKERPSRNSHLHVQFKTGVRQLLVCILFNPHPQHICTNLPLKAICAKAFVLLGWECNNNSKALQISTSSTLWGVSKQGEAMKAKLPLVLFSLLHHPCPRHQSQVIFENNGISFMHVTVKFYTLIRVNAEHKPVP